MTSSVAERVSELLASGRAGDALTTLRDAGEESFPEPLVRAVLTARALVGLGRFDEADAVLEVPEGPPGSRAGVLLARARILYVDPERRERLVEALEEALTVLQRLEQVDLFAQGLGLATRLHLALGRPDVALDRAQRLAGMAQRLRRSDLASAARIYAGVAFERRGRMVDAEAAFRDARSLAGSSAPLLARATSGLALVLLRRARAAQARDLLARTEPSTMDLRIGRQLLCECTEDLDALLASAVARLDEDDLLAPWVAELGARLAPDAREPEALLATLEEALTRAGATREAALLAGACARILLRRGDVEGALAALEGVTTPAEADLLVPLRAEALVAAGRLAEATAQAEEAVLRLEERGLDGEAVLAALLASRGYRTGGRLEEARGLLADARGIATPTADATLLALVAIEEAELSLQAGDAEAHDTVERAAALAAGAGLKAEARALLARLPPEA